MAIATAPGTCHRCKGSIAVGDDVIRYNRPAIGTLYHKTCPGLVAQSPIAHHAGPITAESIAAIVAAVAATMGHKPPAPVEPTIAPEPAPLDLLTLAAPLAAPTAPTLEPTDEPSESDEDMACECCGSETCDGCRYPQRLVRDGYEQSGFDCAGFTWTPREYETDEQRMARLRATLAANVEQRNATRAETLASVLDGASAIDVKRLSRYAAGLYDGVDLALAFAAKRERTLNRAAQHADALDALRDADGTVAVAYLFDPELAIRECNKVREQIGAKQVVGCLCQWAPLPGDTIEETCPQCAELGATVGESYIAAHHHNGG